MVSDRVSLSMSNSERIRPEDGVSVIMPVRNEERHLSDSVSRILAQDFDGPMEVVIALAPCTDATHRIAEALAADDPRVRIVDSPSGRTPSGLNAAIAASRYPVVVRVDGHAIIPADYLATAVRALDETGADNVGGVMAAQGITPFEEAVARAMTTKLGVGAASFHVGGQPGPVLTVYLGAFRRTALNRVGGYDETFQRAQDWEMNLRIRQSGGLVYFVPDMKVTYRPRHSLFALGKQYFNYGRWRRVMARRYPETVSLRYLAAPAATVAVIAGTVAGVAGFAGAPKPLRAGLAAPLGYLALILGGSVANSAGLPLKAKLELPVVYATMHHTWGMGFLLSPPSLGRD